MAKFLKDLILVGIFFISTTVLQKSLPITASFFSQHVISKENYVTKKSVLILCTVLYPAYMQGNFSCYLNIGYCYGETRVGI